MADPRMNALLRLERRAHGVGRTLARIAGPPRTVYVDQRVAEYRGYWQAAAAKLGADFDAITDSIWEVSRGGNTVRLSGHLVSADDPVTLRMAGDKELGYRFAAAAGVPVPDHVVITLAGLAEARRLLERVGGPLVVKPVAGTSSGLGISTHIMTWRALRRAILTASLYGPGILVERMVAAESCRLLYLDGELLHAVRRRGVRVVGDGVTTIAGLLGTRLDATARLTLAAQRMSTSSVPAAGADVVARCLPDGVRETTELRTVYDETITALVGDTLAEEGARIVNTLGSRFAGIDVLTNDPTCSLAESGGVFLEINTTPGIHHHYQTEADHRDHPVATAVLESLLQKNVPYPASACLRSRL